MDKTGSFSRRSMLLGTIATTSCAAIPQSVAQPTKPPNFLFILADDLGYADVSCYGRRDYSTPSIDALALEGMKFTHAYANSSVCTPTRVALATGRYQYRLPIGLQEPHFMADVGLPPSQPSLASELKKLGYQTSLIGKWHMGSLPKFGPLKSGYDTFWGIRQGGVDYFTHDIFLQNDLWDGETSVEMTGYLTELLGDKALDTIETYSGSDDPFFMSLHFTAPHWPWQGPTDQSESERLAGLPPQAIIHYDGGTLATYAQMVQSMDTQIGRILDRLETLGLADNTIVVFTSDNGGERFSDMWPFSGRKSELLEGGIRVPTIVRWPGRIRAGATNETPIVSMDWMPTFLSLASMQARNDLDLDGVDISNALTDGTIPTRSLFWRHSHLDQKAVRNGRYKYLSIAGNEFLFDLLNDPLERADLKNRNPEQFEALRLEFQAWNETMLNDPAAFSTGFDAGVAADRYGAKWPLQ